MDDRRSFLGQGFSFPPRVDPTTGRFVTTSEEDDIKQAILIILLTKKNERAMLPSFGCNVHNYIFGTLDTTTLTMMRSAIIEALTKWEPRIIEVQVFAEDIERTTGKIVFNISYVVRATNNPNNLVFPYYLYEGVGIE